MLVRLRDGVCVAEVEYGLVLLDERSGRYWNLNPTGALVLQTLLQGGTPDAAATALAEGCSIALEDAAHDVDELVGALTAERLIVEGGPAPARAANGRGGRAGARA